VVVDGNARGQDMRNAHAIRAEGGNAVKRKWGISTMIRQTPVQEKRKESPHPMTIELLRQGGGLI